MNDQELDTLFAQARAETPDDAGAADRFLARHRATLAAEQVQAPPAPRARAWWPALLAGAAVLTGALVLRPTPGPGASLLPASAAYDVYEGVLGEGWRE